MQKVKIILFLTIPFIILSNTQNAYSVSAIMKAEHDYSFVLNHLQTIRITIENFGSEEQQKKFKNVKMLFQNATEEFYGQKFISSHQKFFNVKETLNKLMEEIANSYLNRAQEILDSTSKKSFDIIIKYGKNTALAKYFKKPFNPIKDFKAYNEGEYHFFQDKKIIETFLKNGYKKLEKAKKIFNDPDLELLKKKRKRTAQNLDYIMDRYKDVILSCRMAKIYGIEIHKIMKVNQLSEILIKYNLPYQKLDPIFDDRIPENYKVDANDNMNLIHSIEQKRLLKLQQTR